MGSKITKLQPVGGFAAETAGAISLFTATHLGVPVSTTHTITGAIIGVGSIRRLSAVRWGVAGQHRLGVGPDDSDVGLHRGGHLLHRRVHDRAVTDPRGFAPADSSHVARGRPASRPAPLPLWLVSLRSLALSLTLVR